MKYIEAVEIIKRQIIQLNANLKNGVYFQVHAGKDHLAINLQERVFFDYRLFDDRYINYSISIEAVSNEDMKVAHTTFYIIPREVYKSIYFWKYNSKERLLQKTYLSQMEDEVGDSLLLMAFGMMFSERNEINAVYKKLVCMKMYIEVYRQLADEIYILGEPTGVYECNQDLNSRDIIYENDIEDISNIGKVLGESTAAHQLTEFLGLEQIPYVYHHITLGPIYRKQRQKWMYKDS